LNVTVIGAGKMGRWFTKLFRDEGYSVVVSSRTKSKLLALKADFGVETADNNVDAIKGADWILVCVSLDALEPVLKEIGPHVISGQAVMDISSIKEIPVQLLHKHVKNGVTLGTHPVFGPGAKSLSGQNFVLTPVTEDDERFAKQFQGWLEERGTKVSVTTPTKHDQLMSLVLGFPHFVGLVAGDMLADCPDFVDANHVGGASYKMLLTLAEAVALEEPVFYSNLHMSLPEMAKIEDLFLRKVDAWLQLVKQKDCGGFGERMQNVKKRLKELDPEYEKAYREMYRLLDEKGS